jgi:hypothetical protein
MVKVFWVVWMASRLAGADRYASTLTLVRLFLLGGSVLVIGWAAQRLAPIPADPGIGKLVGVALAQCVGAVAALIGLIAVAGRAVGVDLGSLGSALKRVVGAVRPS